MRIGYFGGSFDPPHTGHLAIARAAADGFGLDKVLFVTTASQPLKPAGNVAAYDDRFAMTKLLCEQDARFEASPLEAPKADGGAHYTVDTLRSLQASLPEGASMWVIVGVDAFLDLRRWKEPEALLTLAEWIVVTRPDIAYDGVAALKLTPEQAARIHRLDGMAEPASSTAIRARLARGESCEGLLTAEVERYIREHRLYGSTR